ncbi:proton channel OTOP3-like [Ictalurus furcatus]|uniref:proton channel OTOP3-like n=1 Tax=Ictalurus furcatus TaxID=66913 RepID=UPI002350DF5B|nr:proton channel OTOP3-like [Ictalurus furcatus]
MFSDADMDNVTECECGSQPVCFALRKGYEVLYPFNMEFSLLAGCMLYIMWTNVGRHVIGTHSGHAQKITLRIVRRGGVLLGLILGVMVLISGIVVFLLYQVWVGQKKKRLDAFLMFYYFRICLMPVMVLCSLVATLVYRWKESRGHSQHQGGKAKGEGGAAKNPTRRLDALLLLGAGLGQLSLSYFSLVAALALGSGGVLGNLHLAYSLLSLLELILQNIFIIQGLHSHLHTHTQPHTYSIKNEVGGEDAEMRVRMPRWAVRTPRWAVRMPRWVLRTLRWTPRGLKRRLSIRSVSCLHRASSVVFLFVFCSVDVTCVMSQLMVRNGESTGRGKSFLYPKHDGHRWSKRVIQEICAFLILSNIMLWVIPAFGAHPQFESGVGKQFFGFSVWFVLVNLGQPLTVFYRTHSVGALMELLISA